MAGFGGGGRRRLPSRPRSADANGQQRPAALRGGRRGAAGAKDWPGLQAARAARAFGRGDVGAQGVERIVGDEAAPDQAPESVDRFAGIAAAHGLMQRIEEAGAGGFEHGEQLFFALGEGLDNGPLLREQGQLVGEEERDAAVAFADGLDAGPGHFAGGDQRVEAGGVIVGDARGQDGRLEQRCGKGRALQAFNGIEQRVKMRMRAAARGEQALPVGEEAGQRVLLDGLDFAAQLGKRLAANLAQDFRVAPLAMEAAGTEAAFEHAAFVGKLAQGILDHGGIERKTVGGLAQREWAVGAGVAANQFKHGLRNRLKQRGGQAGRERDAERVAVARGIFGGDEAALAGDAQLEKAAGADEAVDGFEQGCIGNAAAIARRARDRRGAGRDRECRRRMRARWDSGEALRGFFHFGDGVGVEQFAQVGFAEQLAQLILIDGEGLGAALGQRRVAVVEEIGDVTEKQR